MQLDDCLQRLPDGWFISSPKLAEDFQRELSIELSPGHLLDRHEVEVVAHRMATDDILCWHPHDPLRFTVIHLVWNGVKHRDADHPWVEADGSFDDFLEYERRWNRA